MNKSDRSVQQDGLPGECACRRFRSDPPAQPPGTVLEVLARGKTSRARTFWLCRCGECGQAFLQLRVTHPGDKPDDLPEEWNYWILLEPDEPSQIHDHPDRAEELIRSRPRIVGDPGGRLYWDLEISRPHGVGVEEDRTE